MKMDKKDSAVISLLRENSRYSVRDIARKTGIRPSTVHQRMARLKEEGVIEKFTVKTDNKKAGESFVVWMFVKTRPSIQLSKKVLDNRHVKEIFGITGEYDLLMKMKFKDIIEFNDYIIKFRKEEPVETTHTMVSTALIKEEI
ncbi:winged helix-turn-helix transcriptional regulator [Candidatus Woesearchaeota archaeon]|nr:winged helix-turn-helix transcriptional regulator [Candidatus Woesearchaeota archaeon]